MRVFAYYYYYIVFYAKRIKWQKFEVFSITLVGLIDNALIAMGWFLIAKYSDANIDPSLLLGYFLLAWLVGNLCFSQFQPSQLLQTEISSGALNNLLTKPINPMWHYATMLSGKFIVNRLATVGILIFVIIQKINSPIAILNIFYFTATALIINMGLSLITGSLWFWILNARGLKNAILHFNRFLQGAIVPFYLVPSTVGNIIGNGPSAYGLYWPVQAITGAKVTALNYVMALAWAIIMYIVGDKLFKISIRQYEGVGI